MSLPIQPSLLPALISFQLALHPLPSSLSESPPYVSILPIPTPSPHLLPLSPTKPPLLPPFTPPPPPTPPTPSQAREWARLKKPVLESKIKELERKCVAIRGRIDTELHLGGPWTLHSVPCCAILLLALSLSSSLLLQAPTVFSLPTRSLPLPPSLSSLPPLSLPPPLPRSRAHIRLGGGAAACERVLRGHQEEAVLPAEPYSHRTGEEGERGGNERKGG